MLLVLLHCICFRVFHLSNRAVRVPNRELAALSNKKYNQVSFLFWVFYLYFLLRFSCERNTRSLILTYSLVCHCFSNKRTMFKVYAFYFELTRHFPTKFITELLLLINFFASFQMQLTVVCISLFNKYSCHQKMTY